MKVKEGGRKEGMRQKKSKICKPSNFIHGIKKKKNIHKKIKTWLQVVEIYILSL